MPWTPGSTATEGDDEFVGTSGDDVADGLGGSDFFAGRGGDDVLTGGAGSDSLAGESGADRLDGGDGSDYLDGGGGGDIVEGGAGDDTLIGSGNNPLDAPDIYRGGSGNDEFSVLSGRFVLDGDTGADRFLIGSSIESYYFLVDVALEAGDGDDLVRLAAYNTIQFSGLQGGSGTDQLEIYAGSLQLPSFDGNEFEKIVVFITKLEIKTYDVGGTIDLQGRDIAGQLLNLSLLGGAGDDILRGWKGRNELVGGSGDDTLIISRETFSPDFPELFRGGDGVDTLDFSSSTSGIRLTLGPRPSFGDVGSVASAIQVDGIEVVLGGNAADTLGTQLAAGSRREGRGGNDVLQSGIGRDTLIGGAGVDTLDYGARTSAVVVTLAGETEVDVRVGGVLEDRISQIEYVRGGSASDTLTGDALANGLVGNGGNDVLRGGAGRDLLFGESGIDVADYRDRDVPIEVTLFGVNLVSVLVDGFEEDQIRGIEAVYGGSGDDILIGDPGNNLFRGGGGRDTIDGGAGVDAVDFRDQLTGVMLTLNGAATAFAYVGGIAEEVRNIENVYGGAGRDVFIGDARHNQLFGGAGVDILRGMGGADRLTGGTGRDLFYFATVGESTVAANGRDAILDFSRPDGDLITLSVIDADTTQAGDQAFTLGSLQAGAAGRLAVIADGLNAWRVEGDNTGDGVADFAINVISATAPEAADFML